MSFDLIRAVFDECPADLPREVFTVYLAMAYFANDNGQCWPSLRAIAAKAHTQSQTVRRHLRALESRGYVSHTESSGRSNVYTVRRPSESGAEGIPLSPMIGGSANGHIPLSPMIPPPITHDTQNLSVTSKRTRQEQAAVSLLEHDEGADDFPSVCWEGTPRGMRAWVRSRQGEAIMRAAGEQVMQGSAEYPMSRVMRHYRLWCRDENVDCSV